MGRVSLNPFFQIRATRADPPGRASANDDRRITYGAALSQFDELMATAREASARSRSLPLFYALSQAGRAVVAAHGDETWKLRGHGLRAPELDSGDICEVQIKATPSSTGEAVDSFRGVAAACGSSLPTDPTSIGELWSSLPGVCDLVGAARWPRPFAVAVDEAGLASPLFDFHHLQADLAGLRGDAEEVRLELGRYPGAIGATVVCPSRLGTIAAWPTDSPDVPGWRRALDRVAPVDALTEARWLRPAVAGCDLSPLMTWWALLYGLSMSARYEPGAWVRALDLDRPGLAAQLTELMDVALDVVPQLVLDALTLGRRVGEAV
jgi:hypothetical protein